MGNTVSGCIVFCLSGKYGPVMFPTKMIVWILYDPWKGAGRGNVIPMRLET